MISVSSRLHITAAEPSRRSLGVCGQRITGTNGCRDDRGAKHEFQLPSDAGEHRLRDFRQQCHGGEWDDVDRQFAVAPGATLGPRSITVTTGSEEATLPNGFHVQ
jgi:hypothetical protein